MAGVPLPSPPLRTGDSPTIGISRRDWLIATGRGIGLAAAAGAFPGGLVRAAAAGAQDTFPSRSIRLVVPFSAGGATDILARLIAERMREAWKQPVVVENMLGASGNVGSAAVARSAPDGYTLLMGAIGTNAVNASLFERMPYDTAKDFAPISQVARLPMVLVVHPSVQAKSVRELIALTREKPGQLNHGSAGKGASQHLAALLFEAMTGAKFEQVFYRGAAALVPDLLSGRIHLSFGDMASLLPYVKSGELRALAVTTAGRSSLLPDVPSVSEAGVSGYDASAWYGIFAPAKTAPEIIAKLQNEIAASVRSPELRERFETLGAEPVGSTSKAFAAFTQSEMQRWADVIRPLNLKAD